MDSTSLGNSCQFFDGGDGVVVGNDRCDGQDKELGNKESREKPTTHDSQVTPQYGIPVKPIHLLVDLWSRGFFEANRKKKKKCRRGNRGGRQVREKEQRRLKELQENLEQGIALGEVPTAKVLVAGVTQLRFNSVQIIRV
jgi:hypothetical protein